MSQVPAKAAEGTGQARTPMHVVAAAIRDPRGRVLLSRRPQHVHQGGLWEFPGGKLEPGEGTLPGLARELAEELGIHPIDARPLIRIHHDYPDRRVLLDVWQVDAWDGEPRGREGQAVEWVAVDHLAERAFPAANLPIVTAVRLPETCLVTPEPTRGVNAFLTGLQSSLAAGVRLLQLRCKTLAPEQLATLAHAALALCRRHGTPLLLNGDPDLAVRLGADGVHLDSARLHRFEVRPLAAGRWVSASCHTREDLRRAERIGVDFVLVSPIRATASHPDALPMGWQGLQEFTEAARIPVYALGGMGCEHLQAAWAHGAQGIAGIRGLWRGRGG